MIYQRETIFLPLRTGPGRRLFSKRKLAAERTLEFTLQRLLDALAKVLGIGSQADRPAIEP